MTIRIIGAGMAGLLASQMLRRTRPWVDEAQQELPDNHGALLRFRTDAVARETGQPFRRVRVLKAVKSGGRLRPISTLADANEYSYKVTGAVAPRSILDLETCDRYIAPPDFINIMARDAMLRVGSPLTPANLSTLKGQREVAVISTIPMPVLMKIVGWDGSRAAFSFRPVWSVVVTIGTPAVDIFQTIYYPGLDVPYYRASFTGNQLIIEYTKDPGAFKPEARDPWLLDVLADFGLDAVVTNLTVSVKKQEYGKLLPMNERERHEFILAMTDEYNIYSVGRFATWRQILLDDVVNDVRVVESMITQRSAYLRRLGGFK
jgi:hypothetical protein